MKLLMLLLILAAINAAATAAIGPIFTVCYVIALVLVIAFMRGAKP